ncbi:hypothetical protein EB001_14130 [bacterium]|nr:hypothetical protein [bacterium]
MKFTKKNNNTTDSQAKEFEKFPLITEEMASERPTFKVLKELGFRYYALGYKQDIECVSLMFNCKVVRKTYGYLICDLPSGKEVVRKGLLDEDDLKSALYDARSKATR